MPVELKPGTKVCVPKFNAVGRVICRAGSRANVYIVEMMSFDFEYETEEKELYVEDLVLIEDISQAMRVGIF